MTAGRSKNVKYSITYLCSKIKFNVCKKDSNNAVRIRTNKSGFAAENYRMCPFKNARGQKTPDIFDCDLMSIQLHLHHIFCPEFALQHYCLESIVHALWRIFVLFEEFLKQHPHLSSS